ncbi:hypothetical protein LTS08_002162 [Lithohypha guttulata]|nr:hypothetical protein LTS08_002162 [Lithohypha guttulata]
MDLLQQHEPVLVNRDLIARPAPIPELRIRDLTPDLSHVTKRDSDNSSKETSGGSNTTPIVIGVVVPVVIIAIILVVIWRRRQRIVRQEEANDKYRSLDFGVDESAVREKKGEKNKAAPEMSIAEIKSTLRKNRGLSLDLGAANPYMLPSEVQSPRESLRSLSRAGDDRYRPTTFVPDDGSLRSPSSLSHGDGSSIFTGSTRQRTGTMDTDSRQDLLPRIPPKRDGSEIASVRKPLPIAEKAQSGSLALPVPMSNRTSTLSTASSNANFVAIRASNNYLGQFISGGQKKHEPAKAKDEQPGLIVSETEIQVTPPPNEPRELPAVVVHGEPINQGGQSRVDASQSSGQFAAELPTNQELRPQPSNEPTLPQIRTDMVEMDATPQEQFPQRTQSKHTPQHHNQQAHATNARHPPAPEVNAGQHQDHADDASDYYEEEGYDYGEYADYMDYTYRNSTMGVRPLPPDDPTENPEQRANRIRSFYKEYFDDGGPTNGARPNRASYYDGSEQYEQYDDFDYGYYEQSHSRGPSIKSDMPRQGRHRAFTHGSYGSHMPGPRAFSSMSGRPGQAGYGRRPPPKKNLPPPKPLQMLPTPHKLKDDDFLPNVLDFAPPQVFRNQRSGTPDSLRGGLRPYSPSVKAHVPLNSSFDDLAVIPSPFRHSLRKSGTFTGLDFAPPRRFKNDKDSASDSGSVRSNGSNLSRMHLANIRNGAYRVSRIPTDVAGSKDDMFSALKPKWNMRGDGSGNDGLGASQYR